MDFLLVLLLWLVVAGLTALLLGALCRTAGGDVVRADARVEPQLQASQR